MPLGLGYVVLAMATALPFAARAGGEPIERHEGVAVDAGDGKIAYREIHWTFKRDGVGARVVLYRCPDDAPFARKTVIDTPNAAAPNFDFVDGRDGYREGLRTTAEGAQVFWRENAQAAEDARIVPIGADTVADAGFDAFVRARWTQLTDTGRASARFVLPSRQAVMPVGIAKQGIDEAAGTLRLKMTIDTWYGFVAPTTELTYRLRDRRLMRFVGIGTIRTSEGRHHRVRIDFPDASRRVDADRDDVEQALRVPLTGRCDG